MQGSSFQQQDKEPSEDDRRWRSRTSMRRRYKACEYKKAKGKAAHFAHDVTCPINSNYKITNGGRISVMAYHLRKYKEEREKQLKRKFSGRELHTGGTAQEDVDEFFTPQVSLEGKTTGLDEKMDKPI